MRKTVIEHQDPGTERGPLGRTTPTADGLDETVVQDLVARLGAGAVMLTVNQRLARHQLSRYSQWQMQQGNAWWETPEVLPMRAWLRQLHARALAAGLSSRALLPDLLQQKLWQRCIEQDSHLALLDTVAATRSARTAWELSCAWQCHNPEQGYLSQDQYTWQQWRDRYASLLDAESRVDEASLADHLCDVLQQPAARSLLPDELILCGFLQLPPQLQALVDVLSSVGVAIRHTEHAPRAQVISCDYRDDEQEMLVIAAQMRAELERDPDQSLGLVVPELQKHRSTVMRAFDRVFFPAMSPARIRLQGRPWDLSLGTPLCDAPVVAAALLMLRLGFTEIRGSELSSLLLSPYLKGAVEEARWREQMDRRMRDDRRRFLDLSTWLDALPAGSVLKKPATTWLRQRRRSATTLSDWAARFDDGLSRLGWPGKSVDSEEYQAVTAWMACLDDLQQLDEGEQLGLGDALSLIQRLTRERIFQLDTPGTPIQIMGRLESHAIAFDCLWVAGLDSEQWPPSGSPSPFLSVDAQKACGIPAASASTRLALAEREFRMWASQAPLLVASHVRQRDGKQLERAGIPCVEAMSAVDSAALESRCDRLLRVPMPPDPKVRIQQAGVLESIIDDHGPQLPAGSAVKGGARLFEDQALCPFRAFALHRLSIRPLEEAGLGLDPRQHGTLLHAVLERFWQQVRTRTRLQAMNEEQRLDLVARVVASVLDEVVVPDALKVLEQQRLTQLVDEWLVDCELPREPFEVVALEQRQEIEHGGVIMTVMLDRIDRVGDELLVLDYKTGTSSRIATWADARIVNPQLPLYVLTRDEIEGASFAQVARNRCRFKGVASRDGLLPGVGTKVRRSRGVDEHNPAPEQWPQWREHWRDALDGVAAEVRQGLATVTPMKQACLHCELNSLCRVDEGRLTDSEGESMVDATMSEQSEASS